MQILSQKIVIYVTHQLEFLDALDLVLVMKDGIIVQFGKYEDLIADPNSELVRQMTAHSKSLNQVNPSQENCLTNKPPQKNKINLIKENSHDLISNGKLLDGIPKEETKSSRVKWHVYSTFITYTYKELWFQLSFCVKFSSKGCR